MEVFIHNLPPDLSEEALDAQLCPSMNKISITDWCCSKLRKKRLGHILFLTRIDGDRFLASYGEVQVPGVKRPISRLMLLGFHVLCRMSNREPSEHDLRHLAWQAQERINPTRTIEQEGQAISFNLFRSSCGYTTFYHDEFVYIPEIQWPQFGTLTFKRRNIIVDLANTHRIRIPLNTVFEVVWDRTGSLLITLMNVPYLFQCEEDSRTRLSSLGVLHAELVGQCLVYQFVVDPTNLQAKMNQLKECDLSVIRYDYKINHNVERWLSQLTTLKQQLTQYTKDVTLPFGILFQLQALVTNGYLPPYTVLALTKKLASVFKARKLAGRRSISVSAIRKLFHLINWPSPFGDPEEFTVNGLLKIITGSDQDLHDGVIQADSLFRPNSHLAYINRVMITPSRATLHGPEVEPLNRILRRFPNHHEYFIRVQFCDENGKDIQFNPKVNNEQVFARFKTVFEQGIQVAGRTYTFLGFSHSSLRSHSAWFAAPFFDDNETFQTYFTIIKAIGNVSHITSPARCAARIGQAFSDTPFAVNLKENGIVVFKIPDVEQGNRVYSDGVGTISRDAIDIIHAILPPRKGLPTCFQIRLGGAKGMLALDPLLQGAIIRIRPSMIKFNTENRRDVEICGSGSKPIPLVLNRQVIKIMEDMGVSGDWFFKLQGLRVDELRKATATTKNTANFIKTQGIGDCIKIYRLFLLFNKLNLNYKEVPFLRAVVEAAVLRELRLLKHKARIPVAKGITLFGIMDETGFLGENEVFVTYETVNGRFAPPPGHCRLLVTRSPALYDGDIQYPTHIVPPKGHPLTMHKNCIVFSQKGTRDLPSQLSGGDLDGDLYNIIWDPEARPLRVFAPADYPRVPPKDIHRTVTKTDMAEFFVDFMQTDKLGVIATKHMILADQMEFGTSHSDCKKLAQLHSTAVDFSKTGVPVKLEEMPFINRNRPDFLAPGPLAQIHHKEDIQLEARYIHPYPDDDDSGPIHKYYRSEKILGKLYRAIDEHKIWSEEIRTPIAPNPNNAWKKMVDSLTARCIASGISVDWKGHAETARQLRAAYEDGITTAMANFSDHPIHPITELEVFIGQILNNSGIQTHRQRERSIKLKDEFERIASWILGQMRPAGLITGYGSEYDNLERCLACFHIAGEERAKPAHRRRGWDGLSSFKVVSACALLMEVERLEKERKDMGLSIGLGLSAGNDENALTFVPGSSTVVEVESRASEVKNTEVDYGRAAFSMDALLNSLGVPT
ncbi:RNA dependent RNA polymerase [Aspergillus stella-maris]|uniref:RNA dependent RNA polymerase n=1 Tax=Aspergillus stella-maris TaxID=1810926 RepID=UPI003CCCB0FB